MSGGGSRVVLAGGGTGGHVIPALALAEEIASRGGKVRFVGTSDRLEARLVPEAGFDIDFISVRPLAGGGALNLIRGLASSPSAVWRSLSLLRRFRPSIVIGVGGYVAGPVVLAARILRLPCALLEQNATVGLTNRILARVVDRAFVSYAETLDAFPRGRALLTGNPVRGSIRRAASRARRSRERKALGVLVMGGSQGALTVDMRVPRALEMLSSKIEIEVLHQCGGDRSRQVEQAYQRAGVPCRVVSFIEDTAAAYEDADLVIARAGATTVNELAAMGLPAVFLPYPHHADRQQQRNAAPLAEAGAAIVLDEKTTSARDLAAAVERFATDPALRERASASARSLGRPEAAEKIADELERIAGGGE